MFQLIVAVISIALVAALAIASIYYGGSAFNQGTLKANVTTLVNAGQQISGAQALYVTDFGSATTDISALYAAGTYLSGPPAVSAIAGSGWVLKSSKVAFVPFKAGANTTDICSAVVAQAGTSTGSPQFMCAAAALDTNGNVVAGTDGLAFKL